MNAALSTALTVGLFCAMALRPPMPRRSTPFNLQFALGYLINELPVLGLWWLLAGTIATVTDPHLESLGWWLICGVVAADLLALALIMQRARSARPVLSDTLENAFGAGAALSFTRPPWWRILLLPIVAWRPDVRRFRNRRYGPARRGNRLDVYVPRRPRSAAAPVLVYLHGGAFVMGSKMLGAGPLLYRLAAQGWVCVSADYSLFRARYRDQLSDARAVLDWVRANGRSFGADPDALIMAGGSAGAHLAATTALTDPGVRGVVGLYGLYADVAPAGPEPGSPHHRLHAAAPPFMIIHGSQDTLVLAEDARQFADELRDVSTQPVAYAELPGAQHSFDLFTSPRFHWVGDAVARFADLALDARGNRPQDESRAPEETHD